MTAPDGPGGGEVRGPAPMRRRLTEATDWVAEMNKLLERHPGVKFLPGTSTRLPSVLIGDEPVKRETLQKLVLYLEAWEKSGEIQVQEPPG